MVYSDGRVNIVPADQAPPTAWCRAPDRQRRWPAGSSRGSPLRCTSAAEMEKILKPYAPERDRIASMARNLIIRRRHPVGARELPAHHPGVRRRLDGHHVGGRVSVAVRARDRRGAGSGSGFGEQGKSPVSGMFPLHAAGVHERGDGDRQPPEYLDDVQQWIDRIEGGGGDGRLFSYELEVTSRRATSPTACPRSSAGAAMRPARTCR